MLESPLVSVVMGVRNGGPELADELETTGYAGLTQ
jgi:hypothetical protein